MSVGPFALVSSLADGQTTPAAALGPPGGRSSFYAPPPGPIPRMVQTVGNVAPPTKETLITNLPHNPYNDAILPRELRHFVLVASVLIGLTAILCFVATTWLTSRCRVRYGGPLGVAEGPVETAVESLTTTIRYPTIATTFI